METLRAFVWWLFFPAFFVAASIGVSYLFFLPLKRPARWLLEWVARRFMRPATPRPSPMRIYHSLVVNGSGPAGFSVYLRSMAGATNSMLMVGQLPHAGATIVEFDSPLYLAPGDEIYVEMTNRDVNPVTLNVQLIGRSFEVPEGLANQPDLV